MILAVSLLVLDHSMSFGRNRTWWSSSKKLSELIETRNATLKPQLPCPLSGAFETPDQRREPGIIDSGPSQCKTNYTIQKAPSKYEEPVPLRFLRP